MSDIELMRLVQAGYHCKPRVAVPALGGNRLGPGFMYHVAAWATAVRTLGAIPVYSTSWENEASRAVANKLGLRQFGTVFHVR